MKVNSIVLHQTSSSQSFTTLIAYNWRGIGAHFLITPAGIIYQTARINRVCFHIGMIKSKCLRTYSCAPGDPVLGISQQKMPLKEKQMQIHVKESQKSFPLRYPTNLDSIGIELVGGTEKNIYRAPSPQQNFWSQWLVNQLLSIFELNRKHVYSHGDISPHKIQSEGALVRY